MDSQRSYIHFNQPRIVDYIEKWCADKLPDDDIIVAPQHQPPHPDDDDVPNQQTMSGILRAQKSSEPAWRDLGLQELMTRGPSEELQNHIEQRLREIQQNFRPQTLDRQNSHGI
ncbi:hypothetical protein MERGE_001036 [Pneumocystis wakefieldiae]|uniref:Anaphase-promoting complex subunit 13 n=1 Tax=Pneumocystis wakefieldiae TaxID=38082 RepID=A0A899G1I4_9ASCO|nr:hypothetical protein MERGE_001036 [Pneumocystis wakefieldiae]